MEYFSAPNVLWRSVGGETVLVHPDTGQYYSLDSLGTQVWELLAKMPQSLPNLTEYFTEEYSVDQNRCEEDLRELLNELLKAELIGEKPL